MSTAAPLASAAGPDKRLPQGKTMTIELAAPDKSVIEAALVKCGEISTLPEVTAKIITLVEDSTSTARDMHEVIKTDPALSARVLKVVNSAFYGLPGQIASVDRAIVLLGLSAVKNIAIAASISRMFKAQQMGGGFTAKDLWRHSVAVGVGGRLIAREVGHPGAPDEIFLSGLLHDIGVMVEWQAYPEKVVEVVERCVTGCGSFIELENQVIGADHQAFGNGLTAKWKFPRNLRAVVGLHHNPEKLSSELLPLGHLIRLSDVLCCQNRIGFHLTAADSEVSDEMLDAVGLPSEKVSEILETLHAELNAAEASLASDE